MELLFGSSARKCKLLNASCLTMFNIKRCPNWQHCCAFNCQRIYPPDSNAHFVWYVFINSSYALYDWTIINKLSKFVKRILIPIMNYSPVRNPIISWCLLSWHSKLLLSKIWYSMAGKAWNLHFLGLVGLNNQRWPKQKYDYLLQGVTSCCI